MNSIITLNNISKRYHTKDKEIIALDNINLNIKKGEIVSLIGPSGCGKSTLLSIIANLDNDYTGSIIKKDNINIAYMLQNDALLPFLTVYENALLGLKIQNKINDENIKYVNYLFQIYNLNDFKNVYPDSLSGGMRQRVALIRTLSLKPDILLLDEPFSALDQQSRLKISDDVYKFVKNKNITVLLVTHNLEEAITFSNKVVLLSKRPSKVKEIININIDTNLNIYERRLDSNFNKYFNTIWKGLDNNE